MSARQPTLVETGALRAFHDNGRPLDFGLSEFWRRMASDLLSNAVRGVVAEFLVAKAVGATTSQRVEWDEYDVLHPSGMKLEVKASGLVQTWAQKKVSTPTFGIAPGKQGRRADLYVFALHAHTTRETADALDVSQWQFFVLPTATLNETCPRQKTIRLGPLRRFGALQADYAGLDRAIARLGVAQPL